MVEIDERRLLTLHRLRARGRTSGVQLERIDTRPWTFYADRLVGMDCYPDFRAHEPSWAQGSS